VRPKGGKKAGEAAVPASVFEAAKEKFTAGGREDGASDRVKAAETARREEQKRDDRVAE
jgi:hypothetical protein